MAAQPKHRAEHLDETTDIAVEDYSNSMFQDGNNRTETDPKAHDAPDYDRAVRKTDPAFSDTIDNDVEFPVATGPLLSRDGTEASGEFDETGSSGEETEETLDSLEASGTPVDRTPLMKG